MKRKSGSCYIIGAAYFCRERFMPEKDDYIIAADAGLMHLQNLACNPDLTVGDFDSFGKVPQGINLEILPIVKNDTDMLYALRRAYDLGYKKIIILGGTGGTRPDHGIANLQCLAWATSRGMQAYLIGEGYVYAALNKQKLLFPPGYDGTLSVFALSGKCSGVFLSGLLYEETDLTITPDYPIGVSNCMLAEGSEVSVKSGTLTVFWEDKPGYKLPDIISCT